MHPAPAKNSQTSLYTDSAKGQSTSTNLASKNSQTSLYTDSDTDFTHYILTQILTLEQLLSKTFLMHSVPGTVLPRLVTHTQTRDILHLRGRAMACTGLPYSSAAHMRAHIRAHAREHIWNNGNEMKVVFCGVFVIFAGQYEGTYTSTCADTNTYTNTYTYMYTHTCTYTDIHMRGRDRGPDAA